MWVPGWVGWVGGGLGSYVCVCVGIVSRHTQVLLQLCGRPALMVTATISTLEWANQNANQHWHPSLISFSHNDIWGELLWGSLVPRPLPAFVVSRKTTKSWEWPGDEANCKEALAPASLGKHGSYQSIKHARLLVLEELLSLPLAGSVLPPLPLPGVTVSQAVLLPRQQGVVTFIRMSSSLMKP